MIRTRISTIHYPNGELERYQLAYGFDWKDIEFKAPSFSKKAFDEIARMFNAHIIPKHPDLYGALAVFHVPDEYKLEIASSSVFDKTLILSEALKRLKAEGRLRRVRDSIEIDDVYVDKAVKELEADGWFSIGCGTRDDVQFVPVGDSFGYLSEVENVRLAVNSHFFEMDLFDNDSPFDILGTPYGLMLKDGVVLAPPLNDREALIVDKAGRSYIDKPDIRNMKIRVGNTIFEDGVNCTIFKRPEYRSSEGSDGIDIAIVGRRVAGIGKAGGTRIPMGGFIINTELLDCWEALDVEYIDEGLNSAIFAIQVGSSAVKDFELVDHFESSFYDINRDPVPYPPTLYPLSYERDRAPRMVIASDKDDKPLFIWFEGCSKLGYDFGNESAGASLLDVAKICYMLGLKNAVNLDGGGSSEMFVDGKISMLVSSRHEDNSPSERPIPMGLVVR